LPFVATIETVKTVGVVDPDPGVVGVEPLSPPPQRDAETAAVSTAIKINDERMLLFLQEEMGVSWWLSKRDTSPKSCRIDRSHARELPAA